MSVYGNVAGNVIKNATDIKAVSYETQSLTDAEQVQARTNIGAGTSSFSGSYTDLTDKPTIPALSTSISSTSTTTAATSSAVKSAYDLADAAMPKSGGTFTGNVMTGSGYQAAATSLLRNSSLVSTETDPTVNGEICWLYE